MNTRPRCDEPGCKARAVFVVAGKQYCHRHEADHRPELSGGNSVSMTGLWRTPIGAGVTITRPKPLSDDAWSGDDVAD